MKLGWSAIVSGLVLVPNLAAAESASIDFLCSWKQAPLITITVDPSTMKATRSDGERPYSVLKITANGVWLMVDAPNDLSQIEIESIARGEVITPAYNAGPWTRLWFSHQGLNHDDGSGKCWEQKK